MKRIIAVLFFGLLLNGCDDGDLISDDIDFTDATVVPCTGSNTDILYKLRDRDALILSVANLAAELPEGTTPVGSPETLAINNTSVRLLYRIYDGEPVVENICGTIQPPTPTVIEQWHAVAGTLEMRTVALTVPNDIDGYGGGLVVKNLRHSLVARRVTWQTPANQIISDSVNVGSFSKEFNAPVLHLYGDIAEKCVQDTIYKHDSNTAFTINNIDPALLSTANLNTPKTGILSPTVNNLTFFRFAPGVNLNGLNFCQAMGQNDITPVEVWNGDTGVALTSGIIEVTTTMIGTNFVHTIRLKNVTLRRADGRIAFKIGDDVLYGEYSE